MHFCALRFLHFKVLATLASGSERQRLTPIVWDGVCPFFLPGDRPGHILGYCHLTLEAMSPPRHIYALFFPDRKTIQ
jgi:hypothetical protein